MRDNFHTLKIIIQSYAKIKKHNCFSVIKIVQVIFLMYFRDMKKIVFMMVTLFVALLSYAQVQTVQIKTSAQCEMCKSKIEKK